MHLLCQKVLNRHVNDLSIVYGPHIINNDIPSKLSQIVLSQPLNKHDN